jgi:CTP-dependent riboflavin kinase
MIWIQHYILCWYIVKMILSKKIIKSFQHLHSNLNLTNNQILQHIQTLKKKSQIVREKVTKTFLSITKYLNDMKDTPKYTCMLLKIMVQIQIDGINSNILKNHTINYVYQQNFTTW